MTAQRRQQLEAILQHALELPPLERSDYLARACRGDDELRQEIEALLAVETVETTINWDAQPPLPSDGLLGQLIGVYRIKRLLGRGGMGEVYEAVRDDQQFEQKVALKTVRHEMNEEFLRQRFLSERQILASLKHPNVAHLLDGGRTPNGLSYFVMNTSKASQSPTIAAFTIFPSLKNCACFSRSAPPCNTRIRSWSCIVTSNPTTSWSRRTAP